MVLRVFLCRHTGNIFIDKCILWEYKIKVGKLHICSQIFRILIVLYRL